MCRATGATLEDTGVRDEHGFEPVPNFSSPAKSLAQPNGTVHDVTNSVEDSMDIDQSENGRFRISMHAQGVDC